MQRPALLALALSVALAGCGRSGRSPAPQAEGSPPAVHLEKGGWGPLYWGMTHDQAKRALADASIGCREHRLAKDGTAILEFEGDRWPAVAYFGAGAGALSQIDFRSPESDTPAQASDVWIEMSTGRGRPVEETQRLEERWRDRATTLTRIAVTTGERESVSETYVASADLARPERGERAATPGWGPLRWGMSPDAARAALEARSMATRPGAPPSTAPEDLPNAPSFQTRAPPSLEFTVPRASGAGWEGAARFTANAGLVQVELTRAATPRDLLEERTALVERLGQPDEKIAASRRRWVGAGNQLAVTLESRMPGERVVLWAHYLPAP